MMDREEGPFLEHLEALRSTIISCFIAVFIAYPLGYLGTPIVIQALIKWCFPENLGRLHYFGPMEVLWIKLQMGLILALILAFPWIVYQGWRFLLPALRRNEQKILALGILLSTGLFLLGVGFSVAIMLPLAMSFAGSFSTVEVQPVLGLGNFLTLAGWFMLAFGVMFQTPIGVLLAIKLGIVTSSQLKEKRPYVATLLLILSAVLTPPDVVSQVMLAVPTYLLFEGGLKLAVWVEARQERPAFKESEN